MIRKLMWLGVVVAGAAALSGCYARGRVHATSPRAYSPGVVVYHAPPQRRVVVHNPPPAPYADAVWVQGHWQWNGAQYLWVDGHYVQSRPGHVYVQPRWERRGSGYVRVGGTWRAHHGSRGNVRVQRRQYRDRPGVRVRDSRSRPPPRARGRGTIRVR